MSLSIGIVGLPNVGKSTLFKALTKKQVAAENFPFCTIDPNIGVVEVPDKRLGLLAQISHSQKIIPATVTFVDIAGLVRNAHKGEGLGNQFLSHIREVDAICEVVRAFSDKNIIHVENKVNPQIDQEIVDLELVMADLTTLENRLEKISGKIRTGNKIYEEEFNLLKKTKESLDKNIPLRKLELTQTEYFALKKMNFLSFKPIIYLINIDEDMAGKAPEEIKKIYHFSPEKNILSLSAKIEAEIVELPQEEQILYLNELGQKQSGLDLLITKAYELLNLITFFTSGEKETRAWTIKKGAKAPEAAGAIHTDFEKGFIRAEIITWNKFVEAGGESQARQKGWLRTEGKDYVMQDGDVAHFLFNL